MYFPSLPVRPRVARTLDTFGGYNHNLRIGQQEFFDMENLTSDLYPVLSTRKPRGLAGENLSVQGMIARDSLCYIDGREFVINGYRVDLGLSTAPEDCPKQLVSMGAWVIILPDKKYINTVDFADWGSLDAEFTTRAPVTVTPSLPDTGDYTPDFVQPEQPREAANLALWVDTSTQPHSLKQYSSALDLWNPVETTWVTFRSPGIGKAFSQYDGVTLSGLEDQDNEQLWALEGAAVIYDRQEDAITVAGILDNPVTLEIPVTVSRKMPAVDYVIEHDNRLWGCRYGLNNAGQVVNELYACVLGDFKNWNRFLGISTDSYYVSLGADGPFTGAITHGGHPLFFRENCLHKVYGQIPANFSVQTTACRGIQKGCEKSAAIVGEILYYKSRHGICAYDGSLPVEISPQLGQLRYEAAVAAAHGSKYYVSMKNSDTGEDSLFVYDTARNLWHRESGLRARLLCACREDVYCATEEGKLLTLLGTGEAWEEQVPFLLETGILEGSLPEKTYLVKLSLRLVLEPGSSLGILVQYDSLGPWHTLGHLTGTDLRSFVIPVKPRRCDHLRLRLEGEGSVRIFSITQTYSKGSDV